MADQIAVTAVAAPIRKVRSREGRESVTLNRTRRLIDESGSGNLTSPVELLVLDVEGRSNMSVWVNPANNSCDTQMQFDVTGARTTFADMSTAAVVCAADTWTEVPIPAAVDYVRIRFENFGGPIPSIDTVEIKVL